MLIGDFGGGTSDFSVLRFEPGAPVRAIGHAGVGIAGDVFDYEHHRPGDQSVAREGRYLSDFRQGHAHSGRVFHVVRPLAQPVDDAWPENLREIAELAKTAQYPERLRGLIALIEDEQGFPLYQAVSRVKAALSHADSAVLRFAHAGISIERTVTRTEFEHWIAPDLARMGAAVDKALAQAGLGATAVDHVFSHRRDLIRAGGPALVRGALWI